MREFIEKQIMFDVVPWKLHAVKPGQAFLAWRMIMIIIFISRLQLKDWKFKTVFDWTINKASTSEAAKSSQLNYEVGREIQLGRVFKESRKFLRVVTRLQPCEVWPAVHNADLNEIIWKSNSQLHHSRKLMFFTRFMPEDLMIISQEFRIYVVGTSVSFSFFSIVK